MLKKLPISVIVTAGILLVVALWALATWLSLKPVRSPENEPSAATIQTECPTLAQRYGFAAADKELCGKYVRGERRARTRLAELRRDSQPTATYCQAQADFQDAYDLEKWVINDVAFRASRIGTNDEELRKIRVQKALVFDSHIASRVRARNYDDTNCGAQLRPDNFVFARHPSVTVTEFGHIGADYEEVTRALYWRRMADHKLPHYDIISESEVAAARKVVYDAYDRKYGKTRK